MILGNKLMFNFYYMGVPQPVVINPIGTNVLQITGNGANGATNFKDIYGKPLSILGGASYSTTQSKWNGSSIYLNDVNNSALSSPSSIDLDLLSGDFTIELWYYQTANTGFRAIAAQWQQVENQRGWLLSTQESDDTLLFFFGELGLLLSTARPSSNTWHHLAITRSNNTFRLFLNGVMSSSTVNSYTRTRIESVPISIGNYYNSGGTIGATGATYFQGYIDDLKITKGLAVYTANFTPPIQEHTIPVDPHQSSNVLLVDFDGANNDTFFYDYCGNALVRNGTAIESNVQRRFGNTSLFLDGSSFLSINNTSNLNLSSSDIFTIECWIYKTTTGTVRSVCANIPGVANRGFAFLIHSNECLRFQSDGGSPDIISSLSVPLNQWSHISINKNGNNYTFSVNGNSEIVLNNTSWQDSTSSELRIGRTPRNDFPYWFTGYIDNLRITRGIARYLGNFTPPSFINDNNPNNAVILRFEGLNNSTVFLDDTGKSWTNQGSPIISTTLFRSGTSSGFFNGTNAALAISRNTPTNNSTLNLSSNVNPVWTIECWVYSLNQTSRRTIFTNYNLQAGLQANCLLISNNRFGSDNTWTTYSMPANQWNHVAITRNSSGLMSLFVNGILQTSITVSTLATSGTNYIAGSPGDNNIGNEFFNGYIDDFRITLGEVRYPANFTPDNFPAPIERDPHIDKVVFLNHFNGANNQTTFSELTNKTITRFGNAVISTAQSRFNGSSLRLDGNSSYLTIPDHPDFDFGLNPFTIEFYFFLNSISGIQSFIFKYAPNLERYGVLLENARVVFRRQNTGGIDRFNRLTSTTVINSNTWYHVAVTRDINTIHLFINGVIEATSNASGTSIFGNGNLIIGALDPGTLFSWLLNGHIDEVRITKGVARYTANFTPPTRPFPDIN